MNTKIFQICFEEDQLNQVDPLLTPFDNTKNEKPELREYHNFVRIMEEGHADGLDYWGVFGPRWQEKMRHDSKLIFDSIEANPGHDVYLFNHARIQDALTYNVWEQGEYYHKGIRDVVKYVFMLSGFDQSAIERLMTDQTTCYCSYFVASKEFWNDYLNFLKIFISKIDALPEELANIYHGSANYSRDANLNMFPFIVERLFSTFLILREEKYKVWARPYDYEVYRGQINDFTKVIHSLNDMKSLVIKHDSPELFNDWNTLRYFFVKVHPELFNLD